MVPPTHRRPLLQRYRGTLFYSLASIATLVTTGSLVVYFIKRWLVKQQLKITEQHYVREKIRRRFEQTQEDSLVTVDELIPVLLLSLNEPEGLDLNLDQLVIEIKGAKDARKRELWNQLTLKSVEKCVWSTYMISSLLLLTRLQLNILTRREYLDSAIKSAVQRESETSNTQYTLVKWVTSAWSAWSSADAGQLQPSPVNVLERNTITRNSYINEQAFLSISWWLLNRGWLRYKTLIQETIRSEFAQLNPKDELCLLYTSRCV